MYPLPHRRVRTRHSRAASNAGVSRVLLGFAALLLLGGCGSSGSDSETDSGCVSLPSQCTITGVSATAWPTGGTTGGGGSTSSDGNTSSGGQPPSCNACTADQVCIAGECTDVPDSCPCPLETYCDLATDTCVVGCTKDEECDAGRICDPVARECLPGCREDPDCPSGQICEGLMCIEGCREDADCDAGEICDGLTCRQGCNTTDECPPGQICDDTIYRQGCTSDADCGPPARSVTMSSRSVAPGVATNADCPLEKLCDPGSDECGLAATGSTSAAPASSAPRSVCRGLP